jgi:hypothetical protein
MADHKFTKKAVEDGETLRVRFSPEVTQQFARLEAMVYNSDHFAPEILLELRDRAAGKPVSVRGTIASVAAIVQETMSHIAATGDTRAEEQLESLILELVGGLGSDPVAVIGPKTASRGRN